MPAQSPRNPGADDTDSNIAALFSTNRRGTSIDRRPNTPEYEVQSNHPLTRVQFSSIVEPSPTAPSQPARARSSDIEVGPLRPMPVRSPDTKVGPVLPVLPRLSLRKNLSDEDEPQPGSSLFDSQPTPSPQSTPKRPVSTMPAQYNRDNNIEMDRLDDPLDWMWINPSVSQSGISLGVTTVPQIPIGRKETVSAPDHSSLIVGPSTVDSGSPITGPSHLHADRPLRYLEGLYSGEQLSRHQYERLVKHLEQYMDRSDRITDNVSYFFLRG